MSEWLRQNLPEGYADAILWVGLALLVLFLVLVVVRMLRRMRSGTFVLGGRNRRTRLAVMDATAVDARRRLVLVRRDDVEHLILIGGPTDVVVEQDIRMVPRAARPPEGPVAEAPRQAPSAADIQRAREMTQPPRAADPTRPPEQPRAAEAQTARTAEPPRPVTPPRPAPAPAAAPNATLPRPQMPMSAPPAPPPASNRYATPAPPQSATPASRPPPSSRLPAARDLSDELLNDIDLSLKEAIAEPAKRPSPDEEMTRLLGELTKK